MLGPVEVVDGDGHVAVPAKQLRLLAALAVADGDPVEADALVEAVWDGAPARSARKLLQVYVSQLRKALPETVEIVTRPGAYSLQAPADALDARRFERLLEEGLDAGRLGNHALAASLAARALALWRGRAYGELSYDDFARGEAERLEELRLAALEAQLDAELSLGRQSDVVGESVALAAEHPLRERFQELAMLALYRCGRQSEALDHYAAVRTRLHDELGLEPGPDLRELQGRILRHDPLLDRVAAEQPLVSALPVPPTPLVGRERELEQLGRLLERREPRLLVLTGAGGSGKTRLALEAARTVAGSYANGAVLVELASLRDPALVAATIADALEVTERPDEAREKVLVHVLAQQELLLIVDNAEHLVEAAPLFARLVARAPRLTVLVTSRAVLHVSGEHVFPVAPLEEDAAVELFVGRARLLEPAFDRTLENESDLREICRRLDGLPLAIELAAARVRTLTPRALLERLGVRLGLLTGGPRDLPARQQTLRETIDWSVELLTAREREIFARLAVFPAGATLEAAEAVCDADLDSLAKLVDVNLVLRADTGGEARFDLLETIREYALELLGDDRRAVELALAEYLATLVERATLKGVGMEVWVARLDAEVDNLRAALAAAAGEDDPELELRFAGALWRYWRTRGSLAEGRERVAAALARGDATPSVPRARALAGAAGLAFSHRDSEQAKVLAAEAIGCAQAAGTLYEESSALVVLGAIANNERDWDAARRHLGRSIEISEELGIEPVTERLNLGITALESGDYEAAVELFEDLLARHRRTSNDEGIGFVLLNLGLARHRLGDDETARRDFDEASECFERLGFRAHVAHAVLGAAATEARGGRCEEAARLLGRACGELDDLGWSADDFDPDLPGEVERAAREALGDDAFAASYEAGLAAATMRPS